MVAASNADFKLVLSFMSFSVVGLNLYFFQSISKLAPEMRSVFRANFVENAESPKDKRENRCLG